MCNRAVISMDEKERIALIRKGNELFNKGEIESSVKIFLQTDYKDGIARVGDFYYYEKKQPLIAVKFYKKASMHDKVNEIYERMLYALGQWMGDKDVKEKKEASPPEKSVYINVSPKLKKAAEEILKKSKS